MKAYEIPLWFIVLLFSLSFHESAHAFVSWRFGDDTAKLLGRISLNPIVHIDPVGTIIFPLLSALTTIPLIGWAKPTPVNPSRWSDRTWGNIWVSAAGPISNFTLAIIFFGIMKAALMTGVIFLNNQPDSFYGVFTGNGILDPIARLLFIAVTLNVSLGVFNLFPIPPLDGSHVVESLLPYEMAKGYEQIAKPPFNLILFYGLLYLGVFSAVITPVMIFVIRLLLS